MTTVSEKQSKGRNGTASTGNGEITGDLDKNSFAEGTMELDLQRTGVAYIEPVTTDDSSRTF